MKWLLLLSPLLCGAVKFHETNDFALDGTTTCAEKYPAAPALVNITCPILCVKDLSLCPAGYDKCDEGFTLCADGMCYKGADDVCSKDQGEAYIPQDNDICACTGFVTPTFVTALARETKQKACRRISGDDTGVAYTLPGKIVINGEKKNADNQSVACELLFGRTFNDSVYDIQKQVDGPVTLICDNSPGPTGSEGLFVAMYAGWGAFAFLNLVWYFVKKSVEKFDEDPADATQISHGYQSNFIGTLLFAYFVVLTLTWPALFVWVCNEYYVTFAEFFHFEYAYMYNFMACLWHASSAWFVFSKFISPYLRNFYRIRVPFEQAVYVQIWKLAEADILLEDDSKVTAAVRWMNQKMADAFGAPSEVTTESVYQTEEGTRYFDHQCSRHTYQEDSKTFEAVAMTVPATNNGLHAQIEGITEAKARTDLETAGENYIQVKVPNIFVAFAQEFTSYFYIYQFFILWVQFFWDYYYMGFIFMSLILVSGTIKVFMKRSSELKIKSMAESETECWVIREGKWVLKSSRQLVPQDIIRIEVDMSIPCDAAVLSGSCILDESMLTGESMPIQKFTLASDNNEYKKMGGHSKNSLFAGTKVLDVQIATGSEHVLAIVVNVGAHTEKGQLVSGILFAPKVAFVFDEHLKIVTIILMSWAIVATLLLYMVEAFRGPSGWLYTIFTVCWVLPPLLPAVLVIGQSTSANRLRQQNIFCVDLPRITIAGKVRAFCFDKTGTLTTHGLTFNGLVPLTKGEKAEFAELQKGEFEPMLGQAIGCAHTLSKLGDRFVGNPVDEEMFRASGWKFIADTSGNKYEKDGVTMTVIKQHEFDHARMSMAVLMLIGDEVHVFTKGSFEAVKKLSNDSSIPSDYDDVAQGLAANGCYTLGIAHRNLGTISADVARAMSRDECEEGNELIALMTFRNNLKDDTTAAIKALKDGNVRPVMITGDTAMTGVYIATQCGMTVPDAQVVLGELKKGTTPAEATMKDIVWTTISNSTGQKSGEVDVDSLIVNVGGNKAPIELAMDGKVFDVLFKEGKFIRDHLDKCRVFARMTPVNKVDCVQLHMETDITAMCGDGGNDCGALRAAHVGLAMSDAEASIVSPFSTSDHSVFSCVTLLREGRCCLSTSFYAYGFMIMYGETIVLSNMIFLYFGAQLAQWVWILTEGILVPVLSAALAQTKPAATLAPTRPTARLLGPETLVSIIGVLIINLCFMIGMISLLFGQEWFNCREWDSSKVDLAKWWLLADNFEGEVLGLLVMFQVLTAALVGNFGAGYRQTFMKNYVFVAVYVIFFVFVSFITLADPNPVGCLFRFNCGTPGINWNSEDAADIVPDFGQQPYINLIEHNVFPRGFRWKIWIIAVCNLMTVLVYIRLIVLGPVRTWLRKTYGSGRKFVEV